jgi:hypothetical protein
MVGENGCAIYVAPVPYAEMDGPLDITMSFKDVDFDQESQTFAIIYWNPGNKY